MLAIGRIINFYRWVAKNEQGTLKVYYSRSGNGWHAEVLNGLS